MTEVNQLATGFSTRSAGRGPIAVRADVGFFALCGLLRADISPVQTLPQRLDGPSRPFDDHRLPA
jgi:hypothetical protein